MIVVTVEMFPLGLERARYKLGNVIITNDDTGDRETGNYDVLLETVERDGTLKEVHRCRVEDFTRANGVFQLLSLALDCVRPGAWFAASKAPSNTPLLACWNADSSQVAKVQKINGKWWKMIDGVHTMGHVEDPSHVMYIPPVK